MGTGLVVADWIKQLADDERKRDAVRAREEETAARKADLIRVHGRRLLEELHATSRRSGKSLRGIACAPLSFEDTQPEGGFVVRKPESPAVSLTVAPHLEAAAVGCHYRFTASNGLPPREDRFELVFMGDEMETLQVKHHGNGRFTQTGRGGDLVERIAQWNNLVKETL